MWSEGALVMVTEDGLRQRFAPRNDEVSERAYFWAPVLPQARASE
jgi:hypothetical protein